MWKKKKQKKKTNLAEWIGEILKVDDKGRNLTVTDWGGAGPDFSIGRLKTAFGTLS